MLHGVAFQKIFQGKENIKDTSDTSKWVVLLFSTKALVILPPCESMWCRQKVTKNIIFSLQLSSHWWDISWYLSLYQTEWHVPYSAWSEGKIMKISMPGNVMIMVNWAMWRQMKTTQSLDKLVHIPAPVPFLVWGESFGMCILLDAKRSYHSGWIWYPNKIHS